MESYIVQDRVTLQNIKIEISDGVLSMTETTDDISEVMLLADAKAGKNWELFVSDGVLAWEEAVGIATGYIEMPDVITGIDWRLYILDGQFAYSHILGIKTELESRITESGEKISQVFSDFSIRSGIIRSEAVLSPSFQNLDIDSRQARSITAESRIQ